MDFEKMLITESDIKKSAESFAKEPAVILEGQNALVMTNELIKVNEEVQKPQVDFEKQGEIQMIDFKNISKC